MTAKHVKSRPYLWPWNGDLRPDNTVLIVIDMQTDRADPPAARRDAQGRLARHAHP